MFEHFKCSGKIIRLSRLFQVHPETYKLRDTKEIKKTSTFLKFHLDVCYVLKLEGKLKVKLKHK